jgi:hypothetical protein
MLIDDVSRASLSQDQESEVSKYKTATNFNPRADDLRYSTDPSQVPPTTIKTQLDFSLSQSSALPSGQVIVSTVDESMFEKYYAKDVETPVT